MAHCFYPTRLKLVWQSYLAILTSLIAAQVSGMSADPSTGQKIIDAGLAKVFDTQNNLLSISGIEQRTLDKMQFYLVFE